MNKSVVCKRCGEGGLFWSQTNAGKWYLGNPQYHAFEDGKTVITHFSGHNCKPTPEQEAKFQAEQQAKREQAEQEQAELDAKIKAQEEADAKLSYLGEQGQKVEVAGQVVKKVWIDTAYGQSCLIVVRNESHLVKMFTTAKWADEVEEKNEVVVAGEVKGFDDYDNLPNTILRRPKLVS